MVLIAIAPVVAGLLIGYARGGRLRHLAGIRVRAIFIPLLIAAAQLSGLGRPWPALIFGLVGLWVLLNLRGRTRIVQVALLLIVVGGAMNATAIAANGKMPYKSADPPAARASQISSAKHTPIDSDTRLPWLADIIPFHPLRAHLSVGDLVLFVGIGSFVASAMRPPRRLARTARIPQGGRQYPAGTVDTSQPHG